MTEPTLTAVPVPAASTATVRVLFFGPARAGLGIAQAELNCPGEMSIELFWSQLLSWFSELNPLRATIRLARDGEFLGPSDRVRPGDEIALIPPVSGG